MAILIVEDNRSVLTLLIETLHRGGHEVLAVVDGQEALAELRSRIPALVLLDLDLPKVGGYEVLKQIRQSPATAHVPVIILTAHSQPDDVRLALELGAQDFIAKPFAPSELLRRVTRAQKAVDVGRRPQAPASTGDRAPSRGAEAGPAADDDQASIGAMPGSALAIALL